MAEYTGSFDELLIKAFGVYTQVPVYFPGSSKPEVMSKDGKALYHKRTGAYLFDRFGFQISDANLSFRGEDEAGGAEVWYLPEATVVDIGISKNIVQTQMPGRNGTVKELISEGDWILTFRGFIINQSKQNQVAQYPREDRKRMTQVFKTNQSMRVYSRLLNDLDIHQVVITDLRFPPMEGYVNVQPYELICLSDDEIVLDLNNV